MIKETEHFDTCQNTFGLTELTEDETTTIQYPKIQIAIFATNWLQAEGLFQLIEIACAKLNPHK